MNLRDELTEALMGWPVGECERYHETSSADVPEMVDALLPIITRETERARRAWTAEHHRAALQLIVEIERGLTVADMEVRRARFSDARNTIAALRGLLPPLEKLIQRRPRTVEGES